MGELLKPDFGITLGKVHAWLMRNARQSCGDQCLRAGGIRNCSLLRLQETEQESLGCQ